MRIAAAQYALARPGSWDEYAESLRVRLQGVQAEVILFPEYAGLEILAFLAPSAPLEAQLRALDLERYRQVMAELARERGAVVVAGSVPAPEGGSYRNRAYLFWPDGSSGYQDKLILTHWERSTGLLSPGHGLRVFATPFGCLAINLCYDCEFPMLAWQQARAGAEVLLVPSCTEGRTGYHRVRLACRARALENQMLVVQSSVVGRFPLCEFIDRNTGAAAFFVPPDIGFPDDGVLARGKLNRAAFVTCQAPLQRLELLRREGGEVATFRDWTEARGPVERIAGSADPTPPKDSMRASG